MMMMNPSCFDIMPDEMPLETHGEWPHSLKFFVYFFQLQGLCSWTQPSLSVFMPNLKAQLLNTQSMFMRP